ncbi:TetR family transcriptional regulator [Noviherbaspirillum sedimenti]|uniref:TetR family transcriptional regulator n=1 Tax=Noviherbaspirillum sedimenti TaxID=2320865 RepID=A0A3A3GLN7_9BURK|nr:TetR family transcriptional regulator [Noviherbaspirillum sedimenti]RJG03196.1 TetR family transcriptional regulator [Noviherbaspirillum sedimenti]
MKHENNQDLAVSRKQTPALSDAISFKSKQSAMLSDQAKMPPRAPGRTRVEKIIGTTIELMGERNPDDISIAMIAARAGMTRTSVYAHFKNMSEIFEQISIRFVEKTGLFLEKYVRDRNPRTLSELLTITIDGVCEFFNQSHSGEPLDLAAHVPFDARKAVKDYDKVSALMYRSFGLADWPIQPLSEDDPFCILVLLQEALFSTSMQRHGIITKEYAELTKNVALDFMAGVNKRFQNLNDPKEIGDLNARIATAVSQLTTSSDLQLLKVTAEQLEALSRLADKK